MARPDRGCPSPELFDQRVDYVLEDASLPDNGPLAFVGCAVVENLRDHVEVFGTPQALSDRP